MRRATRGRELVTPDVVNRAMVGKDPAPLAPAMAAGLAARRTKSHAALVFSVLDFDPQGAGAADGKTTGTTQIALYGTAGEVVWTLNAKLSLSGDEARTLPGFVREAVVLFESDVEEAMAGLDPEDP